MAIVPVQQPLMTVPQDGNSNNTQASDGQYHGQYQGGNYQENGWLRNRVFALEGQVAEMKTRHDAEMARERKKKDKEDFHMAISEKMTSKLDFMCEILLCKKGKEADEGVSKLREGIGELNRRIQECVGPSSTAQATMELEAMGHLRKEQEERSMLEKRLSTLEKETSELCKLMDVAQKQAELWKEEALRPGNKRTCRGMAATTSPYQHIRETPKKPTQVTMVRDEYLGWVVKRHALEVTALRESRARELNGRREVKQELEREELANRRAALAFDKGRAGETKGKGVVIEDSDNTSGGNDEEGLNDVGGDVGSS
ncbi:hypothetical protein CBR_g29673 [Chara braunii]|uniref:Uncharacterized protein n=1 Tax=Chara braunii TaxID=69332 RepID=A0A388LB60_CHABU|nr:hypothetical protein CBR_g29673 [Chara braunii]|eukprot:GBG79526.1 hypothetical protein CBR_g29673 [Chara braunii]